MSYAIIAATPDPLTHCAKWGWNLHPADSTVLQWGLPLCFLGLLHTSLSISLKQKPKSGHYFAQTLLMAPISVLTWAQKAQWVWHRLILLILLLCSSHVSPFTVPSLCRYILPQGLAHPPHSLALLQSRQPFYCPFFV